MTVKIVTADAEETRMVGANLANLVRAGDLIMLSGDLGAGKTTFTQGLGQGMGVRGRVASPTFIIAREHPNPGGLPLIHADAYRITDLDDLETLDLDSSLSAAVTVIEWGEGKAEGLNPDRLEVRIERAHGTEAAASTAESQHVDIEFLDDGQRTLVFNPMSDRWNEDDLRALATGLTENPEDGEE